MKMKSKPKRVITIDVKKWCRYVEHDESTGKYCAYGFGMAQDKNFWKAANKKASVGLHKEYFGYSPTYCKAISTFIADVNDGAKGPKRRELLKKLFKEAGYQLKFKNL